MTRQLQAAGIEVLKPSAFIFTNGVRTEAKLGEIKLSSFRVVTVLARLADVQTVAFIAAGCHWA